MKTTIVAVTFALCAAGCASNPPAQDPSSAAAETTGDPSTAPPPSTVAFGSAATATTPTTTPSTSGATSMMATGNNPGSTSPPAAAPVATDAPTSTVTATNPAADNTKVNVRDRSGTLTPINQGNSKAEIGITASIRRGVMGDHTLSFTAKNVKIITVGTVVTLRGPVKSDAERSTIESLARQTAGVTDVDDQLEVK
jgi:hyperosmotically inducible periplasmic protein